MKVIRGTDVRFECGVKADPTTPVTTTWLKNKNEVSMGWRYVFTLDELYKELENSESDAMLLQYGYIDISLSHSFANPRVSLDESNLIITNVIRGDEGNYTCLIKSELDQKAASAHLTVMGMTHLKQMTSHHTCYVVSFFNCMLTLACRPSRSSH